MSKKSRLIAPLLHHSYRFCLLILSAFTLFAPGYADQKAGAQVAYINDPYPHQGSYGGGREDWNNQDRVYRHEPWYDENNVYYNNDDQAYPYYYDQNPYYHYNPNYYYNPLPDPKSNFELHLN